MKLVILKEDDNNDLYAQAMATSKEKLSGDYIHTIKEYLVLEKFLEDCKTYGSYNLSWRFSDNDLIWFDTSLKVLESVVITKQCTYKDTLFIVELFNEFLGRAGDDEELKYLGDYNKLLEYIQNRIIHKQIS